MESESSQISLKICRHCSVASRTDAASCPSCGKPYERRIWRWWFAIPIVVLAFGIGYFGISRLIDDDNPAGVTADEAAAVTPGISRPDLEDQLGEAPQYERKRGNGEGAPSCAYYGISDEPDAAWEFCFQDDKLITSHQVGGQAAGAVPTPP